jgi:hypothetical protein
MSDDEQPMSYPGPRPDFDRVTDPLLRLSLENLWDAGESTRVRRASPREDYFPVADPDADGWHDLEAHVDALAYLVEQDGLQRDGPLDEDRFHAIWSAYFDEQELDEDERDYLVGVGLFDVARRLIDRQDEVRRNRYARPPKE